jgi:hypothetical protein
MRIILGLLASMSFFSPKAQTLLPTASMNFMQWQPFGGYAPFNDSIQLNQKWHLTGYSGVSAGFGYFNGLSATVISAPVVGMQLNRQLNNNLIAFAGVSVAPSFFNINSSFINPAFNKSYPGGGLSNAYGFGMNSGVQLGLMYINDAKTFSISGSFGIEQSSYPVYPAERMNSKKQ